MGRIGAKDIDEFAIIIDRAKRAKFQPQTLEFSW